jgi:hypothetical protein
VVDFKAKANYVRSGNNQGHNRNAYSYANKFKKDEEEENKGARSHRASDARLKGAQIKDKEQKSDKIEIMKRLEREKKVLQKKLKDEDEKKIKRPLVKQRKNSKNDWTKSYQKGKFDEDEDYF